MFRPLRRKKQLLSSEETEKILITRTHGILSVLGDDDYPYGVPLSFVYSEGKIYFHSAKSGHKIDALLRHPKVSFTVVDQDVIVPESFTTYFRSVIVFGKARLVEGNEIYLALQALAEKYSPDETQEALDRELASGLPAIVAIDIDHLSGKEAIELVRARPV